MSYYRVHPPEQTPPGQRFVMGAIAVLLPLGLLAGWMSARAVPVTVDGTFRFVISGTTMADLYRAGALRSRPGRAVTYEGRVLDADGGYPPSVTRNGRVARMSEPLGRGDVVVSYTGRDRPEPLVTENKTIPFKTRYKGSGSLMQMASLGSPGITRVAYGSVSGVEVTRTVVREPSDMVIVRSRPKGKVVALTFDDGPWPGHTKQVLKVLEEENVKATFFMLGRMAKRYPRQVRQVAEAGHGLGSHSYSHKPFTSLTKKATRKEIAVGRRAVEGAAGVKTRWMRPPYGAVDSEAWDAIKAESVRAVMWDVDSADWKKPGVRKIERNVLSAVKPGSVVLFHDGGGDRNQTVKALRTIIRKLKKKGYQFATIDELSQMKQVASEPKKPKKKVASKKSKTADKSSSEESKKADSPDKQTATPTYGALGYEP